MVSHTPAKFGGDRHRGSGDTMVLDGHVISPDHMTKGSSNIDNSPLSLDTILLIFVLT